MVPPSATESLAASSPHRWLLVADDDPHLRALLRLTLEDGDLGILEAADGSDALAALATHEVAAIVLDWRMPGVDGFGVLQHMSEDSSLRDIPVVVVSAEFGDDERLAEVRKQPTDWMVKPFSPADLLRVVEGVLATPLALRPAAAPDESATEPVRAPEAQISEPQFRRFVVDLKASLERERTRVAELERAKNDLRRLDRMKSAFLTFISHELRTPLHQMSVVELLGDASGGDDTQIIDILRHGYGRLRELVERGLAYIEAAGRTKPSEPRVVVDVRVLLRSAIGRVENASLRVRIFGAAAPQLVTCEPEAIAGVLAALLHNALQYSPATSAVEVRLRANGTWLEVEVTNEGVGFEPRDAQRWFEPFSSEVEPMPGQRTGLSLAIASEIVRRHDGKLAAASQGPGRGAQFTLRLPRHGSSDADG